MNKPRHGLRGLSRRRLQSPHYYIRRIADLDVALLCRGFYDNTVNIVVCQSADTVKRLAERYCLGVKPGVKKVISNPKSLFTSLKDFRSYGCVKKAIFLFITVSIVTNPGWKTTIILFSCITKTRTLANLASLPMPGRMLSSILNRTTDNQRRRL